MSNSLKTKSKFQFDGTSYDIHKLNNLENSHKVSRLPFSIRILLENLLRKEDGINVNKSDIEAVLNWDPKETPRHEIAFTPSRVVLQDFTGVPAVVDLASMRESLKQRGKNPDLINPLRPVELVIDHSVQVDYFGSTQALEKNTDIEYHRNQERYQFLRWGQQAFNNFKVVPPSTGIVHQVNLEYLARVVMEETENDQNLLFPDTVVGTDSHTTMINGIGVLGWGVGGIEAEAAMLGQAISMLIPQVVGFKLSGKLQEGVTATDLVLTVVEMLRAKGVVGKFVEFFGPGLKDLPLADRATIANMAPEYGATCGIFPVDQATLDYLQLTGRESRQVELVKAYMSEVGLFHTEQSPDPEFTDILELDLSTVIPSLAGPSRPQDRVALADMKTAFEKSFDHVEAEHPNFSNQEVENGSVVIAAITSCTNTSNPYVMIAAGLLAKKAVEKGLQVKPWVKTSLAPGSKVVTDYLDRSGLSPYLDQLGFQTVGYGCTTCIGNSGPLPANVDSEIDQKKLVVASVLSGNRNFEGRVSPKVRASYLASPPLVVAYALAGNVRLDVYQQALGQDKNGKDVYLKDIWPTQKEVSDFVATNVKSDMFAQSYQNVFEGDSHWKKLDSPKGNTYQWDDQSSYIKNPPFFSGDLSPKVQDIQNARVLALLGHSITTDHISPAGSIATNSPAATYLESMGVEKKDFNSYGSRRGNHEVMMRGTFANVRLKNQLVPGVEGGYTLHLPSGKQMPIYDAAMEYQKEQTPLVVLAGKEYGTGSSRDWAAKGSFLLGIKAVIAESYERIHRSNLIGMGVLPLQFKENEHVTSLGLDGTEIITIAQIEPALESKEVKIKAVNSSGKIIDFTAIVRIDTPAEVDYYKYGGILQYVLHQLSK
ncbi:MAG: aconitate hydratase AcnA [Bdellovibrionales bacterium]|nr:aconitate hydratase AcnA [Bdellovibrionales bacterium]